MTLESDLVGAPLHGQPGQSSQDERDEVDPELRGRSSHLGPVRVGGRDPMFAMAGIVVTEISTPIIAPDLAEVSDSTPAVPAR